MHKKGFYRNTYLTKELGPELGERRSQTEASIAGKVIRAWIHKTLVQTKAHVTGKCNRTYEYTPYKMGLTCPTNIQGINYRFPNP